MGGTKGQLHEAFGEAKTVTEWASDPRCRVSLVALNRRLRTGWELTRALTVRLYDDKQPEAFGERKTLKAWSEDPRCVAGYDALQRRVHSGMPLERAMAIPPTHNRKPGPRDERLWHAFGEAKTVARWLKDPRCMIGRQALLQRLESGVDPETAIQTPRAVPLRVYSAFGETKELVAWARDPRAVVSHDTIYSRVEAGWDVEEALTTPSKQTPPSGAGPPTRRRVALEAFGECKTAAEWSRDPRCRVSDALIRQRLQKGWSIERAMTERLYDDNLPEAFGERKTLRDWSRDPRCVATYSALQSRVQNGMPLEQAMALPSAWGSEPRPRDERLWHAFGEAKTAAQWLKDPRCMIGRVGLLQRLESGVDPETAIGSPPTVPRRVYSAFGQTKQLSAWAKDPRAKVSHATMYSRLEAGWDFVQALITPTLQDRPPRRSDAPPRDPPTRKAPGGTREKLEAFGERKTLREWVADPRCSVSYLLLRDRLIRDWPIERAIAEIPAIGHRSVEAFGESKSLYAWQSDPRCLVSQSTLRNRMMNGESLEEAMTRPSEVTPRRRRYFDSGLDA